METTSTCGGYDYDGRGFINRCYDPAPYRAEYRWANDKPPAPDFSVPLCRRHANDARTHDGLQRIYSARDDHHGTDD